MKKLIPFAVAAGLALSGCASSGGDMSSSSATDKDAMASIMSAKQELAKAKAARNEWRDTGKMIKEAEKLAKEGKYGDAVKLADKATRQSENALKQVDVEKNAHQLYM